MEQIRQLFADFMRSHGAGAANRLIRQHGGSGDIDSIPVENLAAFARALGAPVADHAELTGRRDLPESLDSSDPKFQPLYDKAWGKFNGGRRGHA